MKLGAYTLYYAERMHEFIQHYVKPQISVKM